MAATSREARFLQYQIKAIRRFQSLREPRSHEEAQRLAMEWIDRFARMARSRWDSRRRGEDTSANRSKAGWRWKI